MLVRWWFEAGAGGLAAAANNDGAAVRMSSRGVGPLYLEAIRHRGAIPTA